MSIEPRPISDTSPFAISRSPFSIVKALFRAIRPHQAAKNLFVYAALIFTGDLFHATEFFRVTAAFLLFSLAAGSIYILNDLLDVEADRHHPKKCKRPIASGALPLPLARIALVILMGGSLLASATLSLKFGIVVAAYLILQIAYCFSLKHIVLLDVFTIAIGFVLRAVAGGVVIDKHISHWLLLCTLQLALFLGFGKRRQELVLLGENAGRHRAILQEYSIAFIDHIIVVVSAVTIVCYSVYSVDSESAAAHPHLWITVPIVIYSVCRYLYLVYQKGEGGAPEDVLKQDRSMQVSILVWIVTALLLFMLDSPMRNFLGLQ